MCCVYSAHEKWENQREHIILHSVGVAYTLLRWVYRFGRKGEFWGGIVKGESEIALIAFSKEQLQRNWGRLAASGKSMMGNSFRYCWNLCLKISLNFHPFVPWFLCCFDFCVLPLPLSSSFFFFLTFSGAWSERDWDVPTDVRMRWPSWWVKEISIIKLYLPSYVLCRQKYQLIIVLLLSVTVGPVTLKHQDLSDS